MDVWEKKADFCFAGSLKAALAQNWTDKRDNLIMRWWNCRAILIGFGVFSKNQWCKKINKWWKALKFHEKSEKNW